MVQDRVTIGKAAVIVKLQKLNKIAPAKEFSDQLCHHIISYRPEGMGQKAKTKPGKSPTKDKALLALENRQLLTQTFLYDPTITVTEAARRSFCEVKDFVLFG